MVTQITLGNISQQNGRTVINGGQSGIDTEGLIKALTEAKRLPAVALETKNTSLGKKKTALSELQNLLTRFRTAVDTLRNPPGVQNASANIFEYRTASMSSVITAENYLGVSVQPGVAVQGFTINKIEQLARETKQESSTFLLPDLTGPAVKATGTAAAGELQAGTFTLRSLSGGPGASITLTEDESLNSAMAKINAVKNQTGIQATVVKVSTGTPNNSYKLIFTGTKTGLTGAFDLENSGTVTDDPDGVLSQLTFNSTQTAQNAEFQLEGVTITRESNTVTDLVEGVTFTLKQPYTNVTPVTVSVQPDVEIATNAINQMVDIYNELRVLAAKQSETGEDGLPSEDAVLANNSVLRAVLSSVAGEITGAVSGLTGDARSLSDIGLDFQDFEGDDETPKTRNIIVVNAEKLKAALADNYEGVRSVFEFRLTSSNPDLAVFKRSNNVMVNAFTLDVDIGAGTYTATYSGGTAEFDASDIGVGAKLLTGREGSPFAGLQFIYGSDDNASISVTLTQGIGDRLYNTIDSVINTDGSLSSELQQIQDQTDRNKKEILKVDDFIERYRNQLIDTYAKLEAALTKANQLLSLLDAQAQARNSSS